MKSRVEHPNPFEIGLVTSLVIFAILAEVIDGIDRPEYK